MCGLSVIDGAIDQVCKPVFEPEEDILSMYCDSRSISINAANYCYHLIVKIYRLTRYLFQINASFLTLIIRLAVIITS